MKLLRFIANGCERLGLLLGPGVFDLADVSGLLALALPGSLEEAMALPPDALREIQATLTANPELALPENELIYAPCIPRPQKIICVGLNYRAHAEESHMDVPGEPVIFSKFSNALTGHRQTVRMPDAGVCVDYEAELVVVIGKRADNISESQAMDHIFGYTVGNDLSVRDAQFRTSQWLIGKTADGFAPIGPWIVTKDELDIRNLNITCKVNGHLRQQGNTRDMIFSCAHIVAHLSKFMTLLPGDLVFTGTPPGVAMGYPEGKQPWLKRGDQVVCEIEGIGKLTNYIG